MSLVAWYKLDGNAEDSSGNGYHGTNNGVSWVDGKIGDAGSFNGTSSGIETDIILNNKFSISFWIKPNSVASSDGIIDSWGSLSSTSSHNGFLIRKNSENQSRIFIGNEGSITDSHIFNTLAEEWSQLIFSYNGQSGAFYLNGHMEKELFGACEVQMNLLIGQRKRGAVNFFNGLIDDVQIYDHPLSVKEIEDLAKGKIVHHLFDDLEDEPTENLKNDMVISGMRSVSLNFLGIEDGWRKYSISGSWDTDTYPYSMSVSSFPFLSGQHYSTQCRIKTNVPEKFHNLFTGMNYVNRPMVTSGNSFSETLKDGSILVGREGFAYVDATTQTGYLRSRPVDNAVFDPDTDFLYFKNGQIEMKKYRTKYTYSLREGRLSDSSRNNYHSTLDIETTPRWIQEGRIGKNAVYFDGDNKTFETVVTADQINNAEALTICLWVKPSRIGTSGMMFIGNQTPSNARLYIAERNGNYEFGIGSYPWTGNSSNSVAEQWTHIGFTIDFNNSIASLYVDGELEQVRSGWSFTNTTVPLTIGAHTGGNQYDYEGCLDDLRVYATELKEKQIKEIYETRANLDDQGNLSVASVETVKDLSVWDWDFSKGENNSSYSIFDKHIYLYNDARTNPSSTSTMSTWVNLTDVKKIFLNLKYKTWRGTESGNSQTGGFGIYINNNQKVYYDTQFPEHYEREIRKAIEVDVHQYSGECEISFRINDHSSCQGESELHLWGIFLDSCNAISEKGTYSTANLSTIGIVDGIQAWYPLDGNTNDRSGNENHGVNNGGTVVSGHDGQLAYEFDGSGYINLGNTLYLPDNHPLSLSGWVRYNSFSSRDMMLCRNDAVKNASPYTWLLGTRDGNRMYAYDGGSWHQESYDFQTGQWYHLAFSFDGTTMRFYVNGKQIGTSSWSFSDSTTGRNTQIGGYSGTTGDINGKTQDVRFFNRALSAEEVAILYDMTGGSNEKMKITKDTLHLKGELKEF